MRQRSVFRSIITSFAGMALLFAGIFTPGNPTLAQEQEPVSAYLPLITQSCEGFTYSHPAYRSPNEYLGDAVAYEYSITGAGETATTSYKADQIITVSYTDTTISNNSTVTLWASYESGFRNQLGQSQVFSDPCEVEPPFEGVMVYSPVITQTCEGFTYSHTNFRSPNEYLGDAVAYEYSITGAGETATTSYKADQIITVSYSDASIANSSTVTLWATYQSGFRNQLGQTQIFSTPCETEENPDNGDEDPGDNGGDEPDDNGGEEPGDSGGEEPGDTDSEEPGDNGNEEPGNGDQDSGNGNVDPGDNGDDATETGEEEPGDNGNEETPAADAEDADPADDPVEVSVLPSTGSGHVSAGLLALASVGVVLLGVATTITRFGIVRR